jgi:hypothetical protein
MKWFYPYDTLFGDVASRLLRVTVDGDPLPSNLVDEDRHEIRLLDAERRDWHTVEMEVEIVGPAADVQEFIDAGADPKAVAILQSGPTNARLSVPLAPSEIEPSRWTGRVELERSNWFGRIEVRGVVVADVDGVPNRIIGSAPAWTIRLDDQPAPPITGAIRIVWDDFTAPEHLPVLRRYKEEPAFLHLDPGEPVLYLNRAFEGLHALLKDQRRRNPAEQALHDQTRATLATEAWNAMFNTAILAVDQEDDGVADWPESEWQKTALEILLAAMFPDKSPEDALAEIAAARTEREAGASVEQLLLPVVSAHVGVPRLLRGAIRRIGTDNREE